MQISPVAARILGCLLEKERTTPDQYPLSLNALVNACNQTTNRWPVVRYDDETVEAGLDELRGLELVRREKPHGGRAIKYSQVLGRIVPMGDPEAALICVLLLRGPQTPGELKARTERLHAFAGLDAIDDALGRLVRHEDGPLVQQLPREPGRKEARWREVLSVGVNEVTNRADAGDARGGQDAPAAPTVPDPIENATSSLTERVAALEAEVARLAQALDGLAPRTRD